MKHIFLSYSRKDLGFVEKLAKDLQQAGYDVWYDWTDLSGGDRWASEIQAAIDQCDAFITVISPNAVISDWVEKEFLYASNAKKNIVPVLHAPAKLPIWLLDMHYINIQGRNYKHNFPYLLASIEGSEQPTVLPEPARRLPALSPTWIGGIAGGIVLLLLIILGLRALSANPERPPETDGTTVPVASFSTITPAPATATPAPETVVSETAVPETRVSETITPESPAVEPPAEVPVTPTLAPERIDSMGVKMLLVPAGTFYMGNKEDISGELPIQVIYLDAYYIDQYEVTIELYKKCVEEQKCALPTNQRAYFKTNLRNHPVTYVGWEMASAFCQWRGARLPTDAEWEKAARGDKEPLEYPWGDSFDGEVVNFCDDNCPIDGTKNKSYFDGFENTAPVGSYENGKSPYGVHDMAGNVAEWVNDWYDPGYYINPPAQNPKGPETGALHVLRGGSWLDDLKSVRTFMRAVNPDGTVSYIGFRCAASATTP